MHLALADRTNRFLRSRDELVREGFSGTPYLLR